MPRSVDTSALMLPNGAAIGLGLTLVAGNVGVPPNNGRIRWIRTSDGAVIADIYADSEDFGGGQFGNHMILRSLEPTQGPGGVSSFVDLQTDNPGVSHAQVDVGAGTSRATLINDLNQSDFPRFTSIQTFAGVGPPPIVFNNIQIFSGTAAFICGGSGYDSVVGKHGGFPIFFDGIQRSGFDLFFNTINQHQAFAPRFFKVTGLSSGLKTYSVNASGTSLVCDNQDTFTLMVLN